MTLFMNKTQKNDLKYYDLKADNWWTEGEVLNLSNHLNKFRIGFFPIISPDGKELKF